MARLTDVRKRFRMLRRQSSILALAGVGTGRLEQAMLFQESADPLRRGEAVAKVLALPDLEISLDSEPLFRSSIPGTFPIRVDELWFFLPPKTVPSIEVLQQIEGSRYRDKIILFFSQDSDVQDELALATGRGNSWVAPTASELTSLFLSAQPHSELAELISRHVQLKRVSPYKIGGPVDREAAFFGRRQFLSQIRNRPANYLLAGGRQVGKSSLLGALERGYRDDPEVECVRVSLTDGALMPRLGRALGLASSASAAEVFERLTRGNDRRRLILVDEADSLVRREKENGYRTLRWMRSLSEEGHCNFVLAGFWEIYRATSLDYHSPLLNFGEPLKIGPLEEDACRELITIPMVSMGLSYEASESIDLILEQSGQRANLISVICHQLVWQQPETKSIIRSEQVEKILQGQEVRDALASWHTLSPDDERANRLTKLIIYETAKGGAFSLDEILSCLESLEIKVEPKEAKRSLEHLCLAMILRRKGVEYSYQVPQQRQQILQEDLEELSRQERRFWSEMG